MSDRRPVHQPDLDRERADLLPSREALSLVNVNVFVPINIAFAINAASFQGSANAVAGQVLTAVHV